MSVVQPVVRVGKLRGSLLQHKSKGTVCRSKFILYFEKQQFKTRSRQIIHFIAVLEIFHFITDTSVSVEFKQYGFLGAIYILIYIYTQYKYIYIHDCTFSLHFSFCKIKHFNSAAVSQHKSWYQYVYEKPSSVRASALSMNNFMINFYSINNGASTLLSLQICHGDSTLAEETVRHNHAIIKCYYTVKRSGDRERWIISSPLTFY